MLSEGFLLLEFICCSNWRFSISLFIRCSFFLEIEISNAQTILALQCILSILSSRDRFHLSYVFVVVVRFTYVLYPPVEFICWFLNSTVVFFAFTQFVFLISNASTLLCFIFHTEYNFNQSSLINKLILCESSASWVVSFLTKCNSWMNIPILWDVFFVVLHGKPLANQLNHF